MPTAVRKSGDRIWAPSVVGPILGRERKSANREAAMQRVADGYGLVEAPVWRPGVGLYFSDVLGGGVWRLGLDGEGSQAGPKRRGVGGMALHAEGGLLV